MNVVIDNGSVKRRDKLVIIGEILGIAENKALKTQIMYKANLSFSQLNEYLKFLTRVKLLEKINENGRQVYKATQKGKEYLVRHEEMLSLLCDETSVKNHVRVPPEALIKRSNQFK